MELKLSNIDISKTSTMLKHKYYPTASINSKLADKDKVFVWCEYLKAGDRTSFSKFDKDGNSNFDFKKIFEEKVLSIHNFVVSDDKGNSKPINTASEFLNLPDIPQISELMLDVVIHIIKGDALNEDEIKNSVSDINS